MDNLEDTTMEISNFQEAFSDGRLGLNLSYDMLVEFS